MSAASNEIEFSKQVRGALGNLYDPAALRASGLCGVLADDEFGLRVFVAGDRSRETGRSG